MNEELIYLYRRKGNESWATCDADRYSELAGNHFFEVRVARHQHDYAALEAECERLADELARKSAITGDYIARCQRLADELAITRRVIDRICQLCTTPHESKECFIRRVQSVIERQTAALSELTP